MYSAPDPGQPSRSAFQQSGCSFFMRVDLVPILISKTQVLLLRLHFVVQRRLKAGIYSKEQQFVEMWKSQKIKCAAAELAAKVEI